MQRLIAQNFNRGTTLNPSARVLTLQPLPRSVIEAEFPPGIPRRQHKTPWKRSRDVPSRHLISESRKAG
jgi:hypothetical protein